MRDLVAGVHWALAGSRGEYSAGNGVAMRIAPLAFLLDPATLADRTVIRDVCRITHHHDEAYVGALAVVIAIRFILSGVLSHENSLSVAVAESVPDSAVRDRINQFVALTLPPSEVASQFGASGWVVDSVPLALYCAQFIAEKPLSVVLAQTIEVGIADNQFRHVRFQKVVQPGGRGSFFKRDVQIPAQPVDKLQNHAGFCFDDGFHHHLADRIHGGNRDTFLVHVHTDIFSARHKGCPFWKG
jgi:hypothetical protein